LSILHGAEGRPSQREIEPEIREMGYNCASKVVRDGARRVAQVAVRSAVSVKEIGTMMSSQVPLPFEPALLARRAAGKAGRPARQRSGPRQAVGAPGYLSVRSAAEALELRPRSVIYLIQRGLLASQRLGRSHFIAVGEIERYRRVRRERAARSRQRRLQAVKRGRIRLVR
jgi:hypothetical protein